MKTLEIGIKCLKDEAQAILDLIPKMGNDFVKAVDLIYACSGRIIVTGVGKSGHIASKMAATFASTGTPSFYLNTLDAYHGDLGMICKEDVVIAISYSGNTFELMRLVPCILERGITLIGISGNPDSLLAKNSTCHLNIHVDAEACPLNLAPTSSTTATLALGDALACALVEKRNFKSSDFAKFHPGGSLGKHLSKVGEYMVTENLPLVNPDTLVSDAMITISDGKHGLAIVVDHSNQLLGIVTDGDVRRAMQRDKSSFFELKIIDIMNQSPKYVLDKDLLSKAETIMKNNKIYALVVTNSSGCVCGLIDSISCF